MLRSDKKAGSMQMQLVPAAEQSQYYYSRDIMSKSKLLPESKKDLQVGTNWRDAIQKKRASKQSDQKTHDGGTFYMTHV